MTSSLSATRSNQLSYEPGSRFSFLFEPPASKTSSDKKTAGGCRRFAFRRATGRWPAK